MTCIIRRLQCFLLNQRLEGVVVGEEVLVVRVCVFILLDIRARSRQRARL